MIVRISGDGQYELDESAGKRLDDLDGEVTAALEQGRDEQFHSALRSSLELVRSQGREVPAERVVPSDLILPPEDITLAEARRFFTDEGLLRPVPA